MPVARGFALAGYREDSESFHRQSTHESPSIRQRRTTHLFASVPDRWGSDRLEHQKYGI